MTESLNESLKPLRYFHPLGYMAERSYLLYSRTDYLLLHLFDSDDSIFNTVFML